MIYCKMTQIRQELCHFFFLLKNTLQKRVEDFQQPAFTSIYTPEQKNRHDPENKISRALKLERSNMYELVRKVKSVFPY